MCFTNTDVPSVDGVDLAALFGQWGVETVMLPITYRLPQAAVGSWGISSTFWTSSITSPTTRLQTARSCWTVTACGCGEPSTEWTRRSKQVAPSHTCSARTEHLLTLHRGLFREEWRDFFVDTAAPTGLPLSTAAAKSMRPVRTSPSGARVHALWPDVLEQGPDAQREEAHLPSMLYVLEGIELGTANPFLRRMRTTFRHHNLDAGDAN